MAGVYIYLGLTALISAVFGFTVHAYYFSRVGDRRVLRELEELRRSLAVEQEPRKESPGEGEETGATVRPLEQQIGRRNSEMEALRLLVLRQDQEIRLLQKDAESFRLALSGPGKAGERPEDTASAFLAKAAQELAGWTGSEPAEPTPPIQAIDFEAPTAALEQNRQATKAFIRGTDLPLGQELEAPRVLKGGAALHWKDDLDSMLGILDTMEKEVQKR